ncbi:MAG: putative sensor protein [Candidatus Solibacter sp.]|jgi:signal transduction protein with GAF and PtsI domain|nr:putative sensor protein [Candidatus Solibacter sp.]
MEAKSQVELLHQISNIVSSNLVLEKMLQELIGLAVDVTDCDACLVYLVDRHRKEIVLRASQLPHTKEIGHIRMKMGEGITGWVAQNKSVVALGANAAADSRFKSFQKLPEDTYQAFLSVPLVNAGELIGVINIHHQAKHPHAQDEIALVSFMGEQMGGAIAKSRLAERSERATRRMEALAGLAEGINEKNYLDRILQTIAEMVADKLDSPVCSVMLVDEERQELNISAARCSSEDYLHRMPLKIEESLIGRVVRERQPIIIPNVLEEKQYRYPELARKTGLASLLSVPMFTRDTVIGTINLYTREVHHFAEDEVDFVKVVASQAAIAIENARLMSETLEAKRALETRKVVERAKGIMQHKYHITEEDAYLKLRNESRRLRRPMRDLAEAIILADELEKQRPAKPSL